MLFFCRAFASSPQGASTPDNAGPPPHLLASGAAELPQTPVSGSSGSTRSAASRSPAIWHIIRRNAALDRLGQTRSSIPPTALKRGLAQHRPTGMGTHISTSMFHRCEAGFVARTKRLMIFPSTGAGVIGSWRAFMPAAPYVSTNKAPAGRVECPPPAPKTPPSRRRREVARRQHPARRRPPRRQAPTD